MEIARPIFARVLHLRCAWLAFALKSRKTSLTRKAGRKRIKVREVGRGRRGRKKKERKQQQQLCTTAANLCTTCQTPSLLHRAPAHHLWSRTHLETPSQTSLVLTTRVSTTPGPPESPPQRGVFRTRPHSTPPPKASTEELIWIMSGSIGPYVRIAAFCWHVLIFERRTRRFRRFSDLARRHARLRRRQLLHEQLGQGAHGAVYQGHHSDPRRGREMVAIKVIALEYAKKKGNDATVRRQAPSPLASAAL